MVIRWDDEPASQAATPVRVRWDDAPERVEQTTALAAFGRAAGRAALPTMGGLAGAGAAITAGAPLIAASGPFAPVTTLSLGLAGGFGAGALTGAAQEGALRTFAPEFTRSLNADMAEDATAHPIASLLGQLTPQALALRPSLRAPLSTKLLGGAFGAGGEAASELSRGESLNPGRIAVSGAAGATLTEPTRLGRTMGFKSSLPQRPVVEEAPMNPRVQKVIEALQAAKPIRGQQAAMMSEAKSQRLGRVMAIRQRVGGEAGLRAELSALKGPLPKPVFESLRGVVGPEDISGLMDDLNASSSLGPWEALNAKVGLSKLFNPAGGEVPTMSELALLKKAFGPKLAQTLLQKRPFLQRLGPEVSEALNIPRAVMATADLSAPLRQGIFLIGRPKQWAPAFASMVKQFASEDAYQASQQQITSRPTYRLMQDAGLSLTEIGDNLALREERFMSRLVEKTPGFGRIAHASNRAYVGFLNRLRADVFDDLLKKGKTLGVDEQPYFQESLASFVNAATGRVGLGPLERAAVPLNSIFFSPRLMASRLSLLNPTFYVGLHPTVRKEALASLLTFAGAGMSVLGLAKLSGAQVGVDPRSADFGKIKLGNTRYDIWGGFQQYVRGAAQFISGTYIDTTTGRQIALGEGYKAPTRKDIVMRLLESKEAPWLSLVSTLMEGKTWDGQPIRLPVEIADRFIPMVAQDMYELAPERGPALGLPMALPAVFGVGVQTYGSKVPMLGRTPSGKEKIAFRNPPSLGESLVNQATGFKVSSIPEKLRPALVEARERERAEQVEVDKVKQLVLETGKPQWAGNVYVYLDRGVIKTRRRGAKVTPMKVYQQANRPPRQP